MISSTNERVLRFLRCSKKKYEETLESIEQRSYQEKNSSRCIMFPKNLKSYLLLNQHSIIIKVNGFISNIQSRKFKNNLKKRLWKYLMSDACCSIVSAIFANSSKTCSHN